MPIIKIAVDAMGGDYAPEVVTEGACRSLTSLPDNYKIVLIGEEEVVKNSLSKVKFDENRLEVVNASEVIGMGEHPTRALSQKPNSSINVGFRLLKDKAVSAFCSSGNTGAMLIGSLFSIKRTGNIQRPAIAGLFPLKEDKYGIMLDIGANADCKPQMLDEFGVLGSIYANTILNIDKPRVGLLNIGEEEEKGSTLTQAAYQLLKNNKRINFIGNIEARHMFDAMADVIVTDGFTGNVIYKMGESIYEHAEHKGIDDNLINRMNYEVIGGSPIIGINGNVLVGHGISTAEAIKNLIHLAKKQIEANVVEKIKEAFN